MASRSGGGCFDFKHYLFPELECVTTLFLRNLGHSLRPKHVLELILISAER